MLIYLLTYLLTYLLIDILLWNKATKTCAVVEIRCPADVNIMKKTKKNLTIMQP